MEFIRTSKYNCFIKKKKKTIVHCHSVFELIHIGHIRYLEDAKKLGDILIVTVTEGSYINKGPNRPYFTNSDRLDALSHLNIVDYVTQIKQRQPKNIIKVTKTKFYVKGPDYKNLKKDLTSNIFKEINEVKKNGGKFITGITTHSSSSILNSNF